MHAQLIEGMNSCKNERVNEISDLVGESELMDIQLSGNILILKVEINTQIN